MTTLYRAPIAVPYLSRLGSGTLACPWCGAPKPACHLETHAGCWHCIACSRYGIVTRSRSTIAGPSTLNLELSEKWVEHPHPHPDLAA